MRTQAIILAAAAVLPAFTLAAPDFSNGGTFQLGGSFTPNDVNNGQQQGQGQNPETVMNTMMMSSMVSSVVSSTKTHKGPEKTGENGAMPNQNQAMTMTGVAQPTMGMNSGMVMSGVAQPTMGMNMMPNNGSAPIKGGAAGLQVPEFFSLVANVAGFLGFL